MFRFCDFCGTKLSGKYGHGFVTKGGISCGRGQTLKTVRRGDSIGLVQVSLPCADAVRGG